MSRVQLIIGFLGFAFISQVAAHGHLSVPTTRDYNLRQDQQNAPVTFPLISDFVCRNYTATPSNLWTTLVAGSSTNMVWAMESAHPGDCFAYITYDGDNVVDTQKKWFKIAQFSQCNLNNVQNMTLNIPSYLPSCDHCILRWEWYALHLQSINIVEFYSQCADIKIVGNPNGQLPSPQVTIPGHLPMDAKYYRPGYNSDDFHFTGPPVATVGGSSYSCINTYGNSCLVPSPTGNPCQISSQRCMSNTTYQACGIGATTTVWGPEQTCQTGLVCTNYSDGVHIICTYPAPTPSTVQNACTLANSRCVNDTSFQVCSASNFGTYWSDALTCQTGQYCNPNGNTVYCDIKKPSSSSSSTPISQSNPPVVSSTSTSTSSSASASSGCTLGYQKCTATGAPTYQTCAAGRDGSTYWADAQSCQAGLSCHPSSTANNIYCY